MCHPREGGDPVNHKVTAMSSYWVYIVSSAKNGTLYIGVTNNISRRVFEHKTKVANGFTEKYNVSKLVWLEEYNDIESAISLEKCLKKWNRAWKIRLIEEKNPKWIDLYETEFGNDTKCRV